MALSVKDQGILMVGFTQLQAALGRIESKADFGLEYELQRRLRVVGEKVAKVAPQFVTHKTGRTNSNGERLEDSVKVSVTTRSASVFSSSIYGGAQNVGGKVGRNRATLLKRSDASHWMDKAVASEREFVQAEMEGLVDWLLAEFEAG